MRFYEDMSSWSTALASVLPGVLGRSTAFSLYSSVAEVGEWAGRAPASAWTKGNARSLGADLKSEFFKCGPRVRTQVDQSVVAVTRRLERFADGTASDRTAEVDTLGGAARQAKAQLQSDPLRVAAWQDLLEAAQSDQPDSTVIEHRITLLDALLVGAGVPAGHRFQQLAEVLASTPSPSEIAPRRVAELPPSPTSRLDDHHLDAAEALLREPPPEGHCVAWLTFAAARLPTFVMAIGPVTFFDSDWCIPNALEPSGQEFEYRDELAQVLARDAFGGTTRSAGAAPLREVLARVDLGRRPLHGWEEEAEERVRVIVGLVRTRTGAPSWRRGRSSYLLVDGDVRSSSFGPGDDPLFPGPDYYGMDDFAQALESYKAELTDLLLSGPLPADVAEALRLIGEAAQVDSRENALNGSATIAEQTVLVLQFAAVERLAAFSRMKSEDFALELAAGWAIARYHQSLAWAVDVCLAGLGGGADPLWRQVGAFSGRRRFLKAFEVRDGLLLACQDKFKRARAQVLLYSIGDVDASTKLLDSFDKEAVVLGDRLRRCRNGLMHGNPVALESVRSVRAFSLFVVGAGEDVVTGSLAQRRPVADLLDDRRALRVLTRVELGQGTSFADAWSLKVEI